MKTREQRIKDLIETTFTPERFELENESRAHNVPEGSETHFRLFLVSTRFHSTSRIERQRLVNLALKNEFASGLHALTLRCLTPEEWALNPDSKSPVSPACLGGETKGPLKGKISG